MCNSGTATDLPERYIGHSATGIRDGIRYLRSHEIPRTIAAIVERIYDYETSSARGDWRPGTSRQYEATGSAGMIAWGSVYPWGWDRVKPFWDANPEYRPRSKYTMKTSLGCVSYLGFETVAQAMAAVVVRLYGWPPVIPPGGDIFAHAARNWGGDTTGDYAAKLRSQRNPITAEIYGGSASEV